MNILIVTAEPPPTSSGLGTLWGKLAKYSKEVTFDFFGPDPANASPFGESGLTYLGMLHDLGAPPRVRRLAVKRNRSIGLKKMFWSALYVPFVWAERRRGGNALAEWFERKIETQLLGILDGGPYDAVLVHVPPFRLAEPVCRIAAETGTPFIYAVGDPIGSRCDTGKFQPQQPEAQQQLINSATLFVTTHQTYERCYRHAFEIDRDRCVFFSDCFVPEASPERSTVTSERTIMHWGRIDPWRPVDAFAEALVSFNRRQTDSSPLRFHVVGKIEETGQRKKVTTALGDDLFYSGLRGYQEARELAKTADYFLVSVSSRHKDNIPSKLIDLLSFKKPMLVLASLDSECAREVKRLGIGEVRAPDDSAGIEQALVELTAHPERYGSRYEAEELHQTWSCVSVANHFSSELHNKLS